MTNVYKNNIFWKIGHQYTKHQLKLSKNLGLRRFKAFYGVSPHICHIIWDLLKESRPTHSNPKHLLWTLSFLKLYNTEHVSKSIFNTDEKTFRKWVWCFLRLMMNLNTIIWENRFHDSRPNQTCFVSLDGVDFKIKEPILFSSKWYSHKFRGPGLRYEVGLCIRSGRIVWVNGGYPCGEFSDLKLARESYIYHVNEGELTLADKGYRDSSFFIIPTELNNLRHKIIMSRHETINKRLKQFRILKSTFRHDLDKHSMCFHAIANITQLVLENEEPLFNVI